MRICCEPVLDIKPYVPGFDAWSAEKIRWFDGVIQNDNDCKADERFHEPSPAA